MERLALSVDGEEGFSARLGPKELVLRKGELHVRMPIDRIKKARRGRRHRLGRTILWLGVGLLPLFGVGFILLLLYWRSGHDALLITFRKHVYALSGSEGVLDEVEAHVRRGRG